MEEKACRHCRLIISRGTVCPICGSSDLTTKWSGYLIVMNAEKSEVAKKFDIKMNGTYALNIKG
ncbi:MAG: transcription elongation factor subunit Spt4 [Candidatus Micrarchaeaceae archaeon]